MSQCVQTHTNSHLTLAYIQTHTHTCVQLQDIRGNLSVICRVRPLNNLEQSPAGANIVHVRGSGKLSLLDKWSPKEFEFDHVFGAEAPQRSVYDDLWPLMRTCAEGRRVCVVVYGHYASGKAYTLWGDALSSEGEDATGLVPRAVQGLFGLKKETAAVYDVQVSISVCEVAGERVRDLLNREPQQAATDEVKIGFGKDGGVVVQGLSHHAVDSDKKANALVKFGVSASGSAAHVVVHVCVQCVSKKDKTLVDGKLVFVRVAAHSDVASGACVRVCVCVCVCVCVFLCLLVCMCVDMYLSCDCYGNTPRRCVYIYMYICMYVCMYVCVHDIYTILCMYVYICIYIWDMI